MNIKMISNAAYIEAGKQLLEQAKEQTIPYVAGGMSLSGMDCQGLAEYLLMQCGFTNAEVNLAGSNAHWRQSLKWQGTPEEAVKLFGCVPAGAVLFIWTEQETDKYAGDGMGDANHMGVYLGGETAIHASSSRGCVAESVFKGKSINGGWNRVGLLKWVRYGTAWEKAQEQAQTQEQDTPAAQEIAEEKYLQEPVAQQPVYASPVPGSEPKHYVRVQTPNGGGVYIREKPEKGAITKYTAPDGTVMLVLGDKGKFWKVDYLGKARYVDKNFVVAHEMG